MKKISALAFFFLAVPLQGASSSDNYVTKISNFASEHEFALWTIGTIGMSVAGFFLVKYLTTKNNANFIIEAQAYKAKDNEFIVALGNIINDDKAVDEKIKNIKKIVRSFELNEFSQEYPLLLCVQLLKEKKEQLNYYAEALKRREARGVEKDKSCSLAAIKEECQQIADWSLKITDIISFIIATDSYDKEHKKYLNDLKIRQLEHDVRRLNSELSQERSLRRLSR